MIALVKNELIKVYARMGYILAAFVAVSAFAMAPIYATFEGASGASYLHNLGGNLGIVNFFTILIAGTILNSELTKGTIKLLLLRPYSRIKIILSKIGAILINSLFLSALLFVSVLVASFIFFDQANIFTPVQEFGGQSALAAAIISILGNILLTLFYIVLMLMLSVLFRSQAVSISVGLVLLFSGFIINIFTEMLFENYHHILQWNPFNVLNFREKLAGTPVIEIGSLSATQMGMALATYTVIMFLATAFMFRRMDIG